mmetsp:Transcript_61042/g.176814  ORF Transcript_61042/g.176814 Transcript_61042/m.176814 type:complete len:258 (-) Transcript_61042:2090-2863(-)
MRRASEQVPRVCEIATFAEISSRARVRVDGRWQLLLAYGHVDVPCGRRIDRYARIAAPRGDCCPDDHCPVATPPQDEGNSSCDKGGGGGLGAGERALGRGTEKSSTERSNDRRRTPGPQFEGDQARTDGVAPTANERLGTQNPQKPIAVLMHDEPEQHICYGSRITFVLRLQSFGRCVCGAFRCNTCDRAAKVRRRAVDKSGYSRFRKQRGPRSLPEVEESRLGKLCGGHVHCYILFVRLVVDGLPLSLLSSAKIRG